MVAYARGQSLLNRIFFVKGWYGRLIARIKVASSKTEQSNDQQKDQQLRESLGQPLVGFQLCHKRLLVAPTKFWQPPQGWPAGVRYRYFGFVALGPWEVLSAGHRIGFGCVDCPGSWTHYVALGHCLDHALG